MKFLLDEKAITEIIEGLNLTYKIEKTILLKDYTYIHTENNEISFENDLSKEEKKFSVVELDSESVWEVDKFLNPIFYKKQLFGNDGLMEDVFVYMHRQEMEYVGDVIKYEQIVRNKNAQLQLCRSDIYLMIPGKLNKQDNLWETMNAYESSFFNYFKENIEACIKAEYNSDISTKVERKCIAQVTLQIKDVVDKQTYSQSALVGLVKHETGFCIVEIMVPNCHIGGNKLLNYYCGDELKIKYADKEYNVEQFCEAIGIRRFGKKRSIAFVHGDVSDEEIINALANEELPMGKIEGDFGRKLKNENIAQYDTAEVYVSHETMLEKCKLMSVMSEERISYQAIEIFFVELILFQDAAIDKVYYDLRVQENCQRDYEDIKEATEKYEQLSFDMAQAIRFGDYEQFRFPTVRESAKRVAQNFGIEYVFQKYENNKELLRTMIVANKRRTQEKQDALKNQFLLLLSALAAVGTLGDILYAVYMDERGAAYCYVSAVLVVLCGYLIYKASHCILKKIMSKRKKAK